MWGFLFVFLILIFSKLKGKFNLKKYYFLKEKRNEEIYFFFKIFDRLAIIMKIFNGKPQCFNKIFPLKKSYISISLY